MTTGSTWPDALRLSVGTFTVVPVRAPTTVDQRAAARSLLVSVLVGGVLGALMWAVTELLDAGWQSAALAGLGAVAFSTALTRGLHLDGLADTADGLGSGRTGGAGLDVMRRSDIGPFGVVTLVLVLLTQVGCIAALASAGTAWMLVVIQAAARASTLMACRRSVPAARTDGLGSAVASSVRTSTWIAVSLVLLLVAGATALLPQVSPNDAARLVVALVVGWLAAYLLVRRCVARFGGITGDVLGGAIECGLTAMLVVAASTAAV